MFVKFGSFLQWRPLGRLLAGLLAAFFLMGLAMGLARAQSSPATANGVAVRQVNISADKQSFDEEGRTHFSGNVDVRYKKIKITTNLATLEMNAVGEADVATFFNRPHAIRTEDNGMEDLVDGDVMKIFINENRFTAEGDSISHITTVAQNPVTIQADLQEFDNEEKTVRANGSVAVDYAETKIFSPKAILWMDEAGKAKRVVFTGGSRAEKEQSVILSEKLTIMVESGNLLAEKNVKTNVKTEGKDASTPPRVYIDSDFQQYDKASDTMLASGNVKILYGDYKAFGPKATFRMKNGQVDKIFIAGRGTIITNGRQVTADKIVITTTPRHFDALGNVKSKFLTKKSVEESASAPASPSGKPALAGGSNGGKPKTTGTTGESPKKKLPKDDYLD